SPHLPILPIPSCPASWDEMQAWFRRAIQTGQNLAIAYPPPPTESPTDIWQHLVGIAKYLSRTGKMVTRAQLSETLGIGDRPLQIGFRTLKRFGFEVTSSEEGVHFTWQPEPTLEYGEMAERSHHFSRLFKKSNSVVAISMKFHSPPFKRQHIN
ncbi:MAG: hypothetical protein HC865_26320, partial [Cyanobacteria bacterium RU_5_0]|nr:hypothetical protein [Cyanobacteria bacterium RU_5_0]